MSRINKTISQIVSDVRVCYDEIALNDANMIGDQDESELDTIIRSKVGEAIEYVYGNCSESLLDGEDVSVYKGNVSINDKGAYVMAVDDVIGDYLRLLWVKCSSWTYAVREILSEGDRDSTFIYDEYCGASWEKPAVMMSVDEDGKMLHVVRPKSGDVVTVAYVGVPMVSETSANAQETVAADVVSAESASGEALETGAAVESEASYGIGERLYGAVKYYICALVASTFGETARAKEFGEIAVGMMGAITKE